MNIGIIGSGNMGASLGRIWAKSGHQIMLSFARDEAALRLRAESVAPQARVGTPAQAAEFGEVVLVTVPWSVISEAMQAAGPMKGKIVLSCVNSLKPDMSGLEVGTRTSAAEEIAKLCPEARVVESLFTFAGQLQSETRLFGSERPTACYCGDDAAAKAVVAILIEETGMEAVDAGPLKSARYLEPASMLLVQLGVGMRMGTNISMKLLRR